MGSIAWAAPSANTLLTKNFRAERRARVDERKQRHGLQIASSSGTVPLELPRNPRQFKCTHIISIQTCLKILLLLLGAYFLLHLFY